MVPYSRVENKVLYSRVENKVLYSRVEVKVFSRLKIWFSTPGLRIRFSPG